jgi:hypothetical protein
MPLLANLEREKPKLTRDHEQIKGHMDKQNINKIKNKEIYNQIQPTYHENPKRMMFHSGNEIMEKI